MPIRMLLRLSTAADDREWHRSDLDWSCDGCPGALTSLTGELFPRPRYLPERKKMTTDHRENVMKLIEHVREERREIVSDIVERKGRRAVGQKEITRLRKQQELLTLLKAALQDEGA